MTGTLIVIGSLAIGEFLIESYKQARGSVTDPDIIEWIQALVTGLLMWWCLPLVLNVIKKIAIMF